jgi:hypothetical protein
MRPLPSRRVIQRQLIERGWRHLNGDLDWQQFSNLDTQQESMDHVLRADEAVILQALTKYNHESYAACAPMIDSTRPVRWL